MPFWIPLIISAAVSAAATVYQRRRQKQMQKEIEAENDKRKGFEISVDGDPINLPLVYGYQAIGGVRTYHAIANTAVSANVTSGFTRDVYDLDLLPDAPDPDLTEEVEIYKNKYNVLLYVQQALCIGGIDTILDWEVDSSNFDKRGFRHTFEWSPTGGTACNLATVNGVPSTNKFTNTAYVTQVYKLNRDNYNYSGVPQVTAFVRGQKIYSVTETGGVYSLSASKAFSNNPAYVLLDYLTRSKELGGCGYPVSSVDLASFYAAASICNTIVASNVDVVGRVNGVKPVAEGETPDTASRHIRLYECNITLDTGETYRNNIETLLETMGQAELIWSNGQYKLVLDYPEDLSEQNALITASYTDADIIGSAIDLGWSGASDRYNRATVRFLNEEQDFATDSISYPARGSATHITYLAEDNGVENEYSTFLPGATHYKNAKALAENIVKNSRIQRVLSLEIGRKALIHDVGDLIKITSDVVGIEDEVYRIESMTVTDELTVKMTVVRFEYTTLAWNVSDNITTTPRTFVLRSDGNVSNLQWTAGSRTGAKSNGWLSWDEPDDVDVRSYHIYYKPVGGTWSMLGETKKLFFDLPAEIDGSSDYYFTVKTEKMDGTVSEGVVIFADALTELVPITDADLTIGYKQAWIKWDYPHPELVYQYHVYTNTTNERSSATLYKKTVDENVTLTALSLNDYYVWIDVLGYDGAIAEMATPLYINDTLMAFAGGDITANTIQWSALMDDVRDQIDSAGDAFASAAAAELAADIASNAANNASNWAGEANTYMIAANTFASQANSAYIAAVQAKDDAEGYSTAAAQSSTLAASIEQRSIFAEGLTNPSFEAATDLQIGIPTGWIGDSDSNTAFSSGVLCAYYANTAPTLVYTSAGNASQYSFGGDGQDTGKWWWIGKRFKVVEGQNIRWGCGVWMNDPSPYATMIAAGDAAVGRDDAYTHYIWYNANNEVISDAVQPSVNYNECVAAGTDIAQGWYDYSVTNKTAPANAAYIEVRMVAADGAGANTADKKVYSTFTGTAASVIFDDFWVESDGGVVEVSQSEWTGNDYRIAAAISESSAVAAAANANTAAVGAQFSRDVAAQVYSSESFSNSIFAKWDDTEPDGVEFVVPEGSITKSTSGKYGNAIRMQAASTPTDNRPYFNIDSTSSESTFTDAESCRGVHITAEINRILGTLDNGSCVRVAWIPGGTGGTTASVVLVFQDFAAGVLNGERFVVDRTVMRPDSYVAGSEEGYVRVQIFATSEFDGKTRAPITFEVERFGIRQVGIGADASITQSALADLEGNAAASLTLRARAGGATGEVEVVAANDAEAGSAVSGVKVSANTFNIIGNLTIFDSDLIRSSNFNGNPSNIVGSPGTVGWAINHDGSVVFNELLIRDSSQLGDATVRTLTIESGAIGKTWEAEDANTYSFSASSWDERIDFDIGTAVASGDTAWILVIGTVYMRFDSSDANPHVRLTKNGSGMGQHQPQINQEGSATICIADVISVTRNDVIGLDAYIESGPITIQGVYLKALGVLR